MELGTDLFPNTHSAAGQMLKRIQKASAEIIDPERCNLIEPIRIEMSQKHEYA